MLRFATSAIKIALIGITAVAVLGGGFWFFDWYRDQTASASLGDSIVITIKEEDDTGDVAETLSRYDLINFDFFFENLMRFQNKELKPGTYKLTVGMSTNEIISAITTEKSTAATENESLKVTIPEGYRVQQIADAVGDAGINGGRNAFLEALADYDADGYDWSNEIPSSGGADRFEGFLFPDTYEFKSADPPEYLIQQMLDNFDSKFTPDMRAQADAAGMSIREVLIFASLVEREAAVSEERPIVAQVYLDRPASGMRLEADPTIQYVLGKEGDWWPKIDGDDIADTDSPFNTYLNGGTPPGPICNPGLDSILGVLNPSDTNYLFFVAIGDTGTHAFAETFEQHQQNINTYLNQQTGG